MSFTFQENAPLAALNTLRVPARAAWLAEIRDPAVLPELFEQPAARNRVLVLGGGSNILFTGDYDGLVLHLANQGVDILEESNGVARVLVAAGENWDGFVRWSLAQGFAGLENLILIPGCVGAAPIQNIGAYGVEVREFVHAVEAWDREQKQFVRLNNADCQFAYRDSLFKRQPNRYAVTAVELHLPRQRDVCLEYAGVRQELEAMEIADPTPTQVGEAVERLRRRKLPDPAQIGNAGSFFKNPIVSPAYAARLRYDHPTLPVYPAGAGVKLSAAWLIEQCGFKGRREGDAGISDKHALVLVNHGAATGAELWALAARIRAKVEQHFGVILEPEPVVV